MEVSSELLWKSICGFLLCFLVARLVSLLLSLSSPSSTSTELIVPKHISAVDLDHHGGREKQQIITPVRSSGKKRVRFLDQELKSDFPAEKTVGFEGGDGISSSGGNDGKIADTVNEIQDFPAEKLVGFEGDDGISSSVENDGKFVDIVNETQEFPAEKLVGFEGDDGISSYGGNNRKIADTVAEIQEFPAGKSVGCEEGEGISEEWEWEGVERSELEREFGRARVFVELGEKKGRFSGSGSDLIMQLYGLKKVAMEGPCNEPQPIAFKLNARAKWNAWQRLGNMSPEQAMEKYIALLSDIVPGWTENHSSQRSSNEEEVDSSLDTNTNAHLAHHSTSASGR